MGLGRRTRGKIVKWNQMAALRFQTGGRHQTSPASLRGGHWNSGWHVTWRVVCQNEFLVRSACLSNILRKKLVPGFQRSVKRIESPQDESHIQNSKSVWLCMSRLFYSISFHCGCLTVIFFLSASLIATTSTTASITTGKECPNIDESVTAYVYVMLVSGVAGRTPNRQQISHLFVFVVLAARRTGFSWNFAFCLK